RSFRFRLDQPRLQPLLSESAFALRVYAYLAAVALDGFVTGFIEDRRIEKLSGAARDTRTTRATALAQKEAMEGILQRGNFLCACRRRVGALRSKSNTLEGYVEWGTEALGLPVGDGSELHFIGFPYCGGASDPLNPCRREARFRIDALKATVFPPHQGWSDPSAAIAALPLSALPFSIELVVAANAVDGDAVSSVRRLHSRVPLASLRGSTGHLCRAALQSAVAIARREAQTALLASTACFCHPDCTCPMPAVRAVAAAAICPPDADGPAIADFAGVLVCASPSSRRRNASGPHGARSGRSSRARGRCSSTGGSGALAAKAASPSRGSAGIRPAGTEPPPRSGARGAGRRSTAGRAYSHGSFLGRRLDTPWASARCQREDWAMHKPTSTEVVLSRAATGSAKEPIESGG
ncbi:hypothetical protein DFJ74DRAFT_720271, partial [Hyaloraphidium curvatum]